MIIKVRRVPIRRRRYNTSSLPSSVTTAGRDRAESNDCVVRAISIAFEMPYPDAHASCELGGRKEYKPTIVHDQIQLASEFTGRKLEHVFNVFKNGGRTTMKRILPTLAQGRFIVHGCGHAFAVVDGVCLDASPVYGRQEVKNVWKVS